MTKIGITFSESNYPNYPKWIKNNDINSEIIELNYALNNIAEVSNCDAIVFTGGIDMDPIDRINYANDPTKFNRIRDQFEIAVLEIALAKRIPILGICRGLQLINVFRGGTLHLDNGAAKNKIHSAETVDKIHKITVAKKSRFYLIVQQEIGEVNSAHHQSIAILGAGLKAVAYSEDGVIEAIESENIEQQFLMAVQWHPERMSDLDSPFSHTILEAFISKAKDFRG